MRRVSVSLSLALVVLLSLVATGGALALRRPPRMP